MVIMNVAQPLKLYLDGASAMPLYMQRVIAIKCAIT